MYPVSAASYKNNYRTVIRPPKDDPVTLQNEADRAYYGAFIGDLTGTAADVKLAIETNEAKTGEELDYVLKFWSVIHTKSFPGEAAEGAYQKGAALLIKDQPGGIPSDWRDNGALAVKLPAIIQQLKAKSGEYYDAYVKFARECNDWGVGTGPGGADKPIFLSMGHEMNGNWYSWSGDPAAYKEFFKLAHDLLIENGATNVTFLFNPNIYQADALTYFPGREYVDYIGLNGYQKKAWSNWKSGEELFTNDVTRFRTNLTTSGIPIMIAEYGRNRDNLVPPETVVTISGTIGYVSQAGNTDGVSALTYFDVDPDYSWRLAGDNLSDFQAGMAARSWYYSGGIETEKRSLPAPIYSPALIINKNKKDSIKISQNPYRSGNGRTVTFTNLPPNARIIIYNLIKETVIEGTANAEGRFEWNGYNKNNTRVVSGWYLAVAIDKQGHREMGRLGVISK